MIFYVFFKELIKKLIKGAFICWKNNNSNNTK